MVQALQDVSKYQIRVETMVVDRGHQLKRLRPDENGYFNNIPVAGLGYATRNNTYYDIPTLHKELQSPTSLFHQRLIHGQLYGELGHPKIAGLKKEEAVARLLDIDEKNWAIHIKAVRTSEKPLDNGGYLLLADIAPHGAGAAQVRENFESPFMNTAFSLRSITNQEIRNGLSYRYMNKFITFDFVGAGGYLEASKMYTPAMESFDVTLVEGAVVFSECAMENFSNDEISEFFGTDTATKVTQTLTVVRKNDGSPFSRYNDGLTKSKLRNFLNGTR